MYYLFGLHVAFMNDTLFLQVGAKVTEHINRKHGLLMLSWLVTTVIYARVSIFARYVFVRFILCGE